MTNADNWKDRSKGMICGSCVWYVPKAPLNETEGESTIGRCRRRAPTLNGFPVMYRTDWCGDHRLHENKN